MLYICVCTSVQCVLYNCVSIALCVVLWWHQDSTNRWVWPDWDHRVQQLCQFSSSSLSHDQVRWYYVSSCIVPCRLPYILLQSCHGWELAWCDVKLHCRSALWARPEQDMWKWHCLRFLRYFLFFILHSGENTCSSLFTSCTHHERIELYTLLPSVAIFFWGNDKKLFFVLCRFSTYLLQSSLIILTTL